MELKLFKRCAILWQANCHWLKNDHSCLSFEIGILNDLFTNEALLRSLWAPFKEVRSDRNRSLMIANSQHWAQIQGRINLLHYQNFGLSYLPNAIWHNETPSPVAKIQKMRLLFWCYRPSQEIFVSAKIHLVRLTKTTKTTNFEDNTFIFSIEIELYLIIN